MKFKPSSVSYFSEEEIAQRRERHHQRNMIYRLHLLATFIGSLFITYQVLVKHALFYVDNEFVVRDQGAVLMELGLYLPALWLIVLIHLVWKKSREKAEAEVDAVIQHYETKRSVYRLSEDGELFDDAEEIDYELKPKRKHI